MMNNLTLGRAYPAGGIVPGARAPQAPDLPGERRIPPCAQDAEPAKSGSPTGGPWERPEHADSLTLLIAALHAQTESLNRLAASNEALTQTVARLIEEMAQAEENRDPDAEPTTYLDGSRVR